MRSWKVYLFALGFVAALSALPAMAQPATGQDNTNNNGNGNTGGRGNRGGRGNFDPAQFRQQYMDRIKQSLGATDEEWAAISPKLQKVMDAQRDSRGSRGGYSRRRGSDQSSTQPQSTDQQQSEVAKASAELRAALDKKDTPSGEIDAKLKALRDAKEKAKAQTAQAQKELKEILTHRQEAVLVNMGMLD